MAFQSRVLKQRFTARHSKITLARSNWHIYRRLDLEPSISTSSTYHHFRDYIRLGLIKVLPISTTEQIADIFTKPLAQNAFLHLRKALLLS
jgi:hypothetical protein